MKVLIVCNDGVVTSQIIKERIDALASHYETKAISIDDIKNNLDYDVVITVKDLRQRVASFYKPEKVRSIESFQHTMLKALDTFIQP